MRKRRWVLWLMIWAVGAGLAQQDGLVTVRRTEVLFGESVEVYITQASEEMGYINLEEALAEMRRIQDALSPDIPGSQTHRINTMAGEAPVEVSPECFHLLQRAVLISKLTEGAFDMTLGVLDSLWRFDGSMRRLPDATSINALTPLVGYRQVVLDAEARTVFLPRKGMRIGLEAILRGYAADRAKELMLARGVPGGMINAGGVVTAWGAKSSGEKWMLGVADPKNTGKVHRWLPLIESSVAMVQTRKRFVRMGDRTYGHVLDPRSGYPVEGIRQVVVLSRTAEFSHALATALCALGPARGIRLVEQLGDTEAIIVDADGLMFWTRGLLPDPGR
ncbi:FAD:protein FMN transferase [Robiginitalea sediminis]|uniref:FAD:protein FMN transferase n=1 Tax=Robiginitalea sediminis TaxID=1982593 RepID=UPI000B4BC805|nr:FAD:protein FMN transferase [Robiginitalea sediminis]